MSEQTTAEIVTEEPQTETDPTPAPAEQAPTQIEEAPVPTEDPNDPGPLPEVEATVSHDQYSGKYLVSITTRHPDPTVVAVNGHHVWEG